MWARAPAVPSRTLGRAQKAPSRTSERAPAGPCSRSDREPARPSASSDRESVRAQVRQSVSSAREQVRRLEDWGKELAAWQPALPVRAPAVQLKGRTEEAEPAATASPLRSWRKRRRKRLPGS